MNFQCEYAPQYPLKREIVAVHTTPESSWKIHYVTLLYAIKFHNVQRNVSNVNAFDEHYRNES